MKLLYHRHIKPLYNSFINIPESLLKKAIRQGAMIQTDGPVGRFVIDPKEWLEKGKLDEHEWLIPGKPLRMRGMSLIKVEKPEKVATLFG